MEYMKGVVKFKDGKDGWEYRDVTRPEPGSDEVEIEVKSIGICGSELHLYHDNHFYTPPVIVGHEFSGQISRVGSNVTDWKVGDRVVAENNKEVCGKCEFCRKGMENFCQYQKTVGYSINGGWAKYYCTPENLLLKIPDNVSYEEACMTEPVNVICQALFINESVRMGDVVLVQGCGTIGMLNAMVAKAMGAKTVIITGVDIDEDIRLTIARSIDSIDYVINVSRQNIKDEIMRITDGRGVDVIVEASGSEMAINQMPDLIKMTGTIVVLGEASKPELNFRWNATLFKACTIKYSFGEVYEAWVKALGLIESKKLELLKLITHRLPLSEFREGFELLEEKKGLKVLLIPDENY